MRLNPTYTEHLYLNATSFVNQHNFDIQSSNLQG